jgi:hypothetical protein
MQLLALAVKNNSPQFMKKYYLWQPFNGKKNSV